MRTGPSAWKRQRSAPVFAIVHGDSQDGRVAEIVARLAKWDASEMDQAEIGKPAPDFELADLTGKKIKLSDFRGKRPVVLVFIYGDT